MNSFSQNQPLILLGLNEVNMEMVKAYARTGDLPNFKKLFDTCALLETTSEQKYEELEPWIQWVSIQTGKTFKEHGVFRLGDVTHVDMTQIWEHLEGEYGIKVGAVSPMNAANRCLDPAFFVPDPWTKTQVSGDALVTLLSGAIANAVNENATGQSKIGSYAVILAAVLRYALVQNPKIVPLIFAALKTHYKRAILLDQLLTDVFISLWKGTRPGFSSLFLNSCAHIQHHYMFNSAQYKGTNKNPDWYIAPSADPVLDGFKNYDDILGRLMKLPAAPRFIMATGLHQNPVQKPVYYWRLKNHAAFLNALNIRHTAVHPRMSRDFLIECETPEDAGAAHAKLDSIRSAQTGKKIFEEIENRGESLFVTLTYPEEITPGFPLAYDGGQIGDFYPFVAFVALKNGEHDGTGYVIDTAIAASPAQGGAAIPVTSIFGLIDAHFSASKESSVREAA